MITGAGDKAFVAGADIGEIREHDPIEAQRFARAAPNAVRAILESADRGLDMPLEAGLDFEAARFALCCATEDMREGTGAFLEKRKPQFTGR